MVNKRSKKRRRKNRKVKRQSNFRLFSLEDLHLTLQKLGVLYDKVTKMEPILCVKYVLVKKRGVISKLVFLSCIALACVVVWLLGDGSLKCAVLLWFLV